jgi:hypothetical protein
MSVLKFSLLLILCVRFTCAESVSCPREQAQKAEAEADQLRSWSTVYASFRRYAGCDDGAVGEGYSDSIAKLLSSHWREFEQLRELATRNSSFRSFVLRHVDELMTPEQATSIARNAEYHCPTKAKSLCRDILQRLKDK